MGQHHPLGVAGAPRGVLNEGDIPGQGPGNAAGGLAQAVQSHHTFQSGDLAAQ